MIHFTTVSATEAFIRFSHSPKFTEKFPAVTVTKDKSETRRTGISRLAVAAPQLTETFSGLEVHCFFDFATFRGKRFDASDFAAPTVQIRNRMFDVDAACLENSDFKPNEALFTTYGNMTVQASKRKHPQRRSGPSASVTEQVIPNPSSREALSKVNKPNLNNINFRTAGGVQLFNGSNGKYFGKSSRQMIGGMTDQYEVRQLWNFSSVFSLPN